MIFYSNFLEKKNIRLNTTDNVLLTIEEKIKWADKKCALNTIHQKQKAVKDKVEEVKKSLFNRVS